MRKIISALYLFCTALCFLPMPVQANDGLNIPHDNDTVLKTFPSTVSGETTSPAEGAEWNHFALVECPSNQTVPSVANSCSAVVNGIAPTLPSPATVVSVDYTLTGATIGNGSNDASGLAFNVGTTIVQYTVTDIFNDMESCSFNITVLDVEPPTVTGCLGDLTINVAQNSCETIFNWTPPTFSDLCSNPVSVIPSHNPGDVFQLGTTTILYVVVDAVGNNTICSFDVTVVDNQDPVPVCPNPAPVFSLPNDCGNFVTWGTPFATDNCDNAVTMTPDSLPGSFFPIGVTPVTYTATDNAGNTDECTFNVIVADVTLPQYACPQNVVISVDGTVISDNSFEIISTNPNSGCDSVTVDYLTPNAIENCALVSNNLTSGLPSGSVFPVGTTTITFEATDNSGNMSVCAFDITVIPLPPVVVTLNPSDTICVGESLTLSTDVSTSGATFSWENLSSSWIDSVASPVISAITLADTGIYSVTVTDLNGCTSVGSSELFVKTSCEVMATSNAPLCANEDLELSAGVDTSCNVVSYTWTGPGFSSNMQNPSISGASPANSGTYTVTVVFEGGCVVTESIDVLIFSLATPTLSTSCGQEICIGSSCTLTGTQFTPAPDDYIWEAIPSAGSGLPFSTDDNQITVTPTLPGTYIYNYSVEINGCISPIASTVLFVHAEPVAMNDNFSVDYEMTKEINILNNDTLSNNLGLEVNFLNQPPNGNLTNNNDGTFDYSPDNGFVGIDTFRYEVCYDCNIMLCDIAFVTLEVSDDSDCVIPTVITPNRDGINDELFINCLVDPEEYPENELIIFNQWGHEVFNAAPYQNNWDGTYNDNDLPDGTYFFIFKLDNEGEVKKGALTIFR